MKFKAKWFDFQQNKHVKGFEKYFTGILYE